MRNWIAETRDALRRGHQFASRDIWHVGAKGEPLPEGFIIKQIRAIILLARSLADETFMLRASALTYATLLFIVPFLILMFGLINTFNLGDQIYDAIYVRMGNYLEDFLNKVDEEPSGTTIANAAESFQVPFFPDTIDFDTSAPIQLPIALLPPPPTAVQVPYQLETPDINTSAPIQVPFAIPQFTHGHEEAASITKDETDAKTRDIMVHLLSIVVPIMPEGKETDDGESVTNPVDELVNLAAKGASDPRALAIMGIFFLLSTVLGFMRNVESAFNRIWGVQKSRSIFHTISGYLMITLLLPFVATALLGITAALENPYIIEALGPFAFTVRGGQFLLVSCTFTVLYFFVPNTRVMFRYALTGGLVAGALWILTSMAYLRFQIGLANYMPFFSTAALLPLFLMWIFISWLILLFGTLVSFAYQNEKTFAMEYLSDNPSYAYREALAVRIAMETVRRFNEGLPPLSVLQIAEAWNVPTRLLNETFENLTEHGLMIMCATEPVTYQPARSPENTTLKDVLTALRSEGMDPSFLLEEIRFKALYSALDAGGKELRHRSLTELAACYDPLTTDEEESAQEENEPFEETVQP